jgi:hypothetical protein
MLFGILFLPGSFFTICNGSEEGLVKTGIEFLHYIPQT